MFPHEFERRVFPEPAAPGRETLRQIRRARNAAAGRPFNPGAPPAIGESQKLAVKLATKLRPGLGSDASASR